MTSFTQLMEALPPNHQRVTTELSPQNSQDYSTSKLGQKIVFMVPSQGFIDPNTGYFEAEVEIKSTSGANQAGAYVLDNPGLGACFEKLSIYAANGTTLYETTNLAEHVLIKTRAKGVEYEPAAAANMGFNAFLDEATITNVATPVLTWGSGGAAAAIARSKVSLAHNGSAFGASKKATLCLPWSVLPGLLNPSRGIMIPAMFMSDKGNAFKVELSLRPSNQAIVYISSGTAATHVPTDSDTSVELSNVKMVYDNVTVGGQQLAAIQSMADNSTIDLHFCDSVCNSLTSNAANNVNVTHNVNKLTTSLRNVIIGMRPAVRSFHLPDSFFCRNGLNYFQIKAGTRIAPAAGITLNSEVSSAKPYVELSKCFKSLHSGSGSIWLPKYHDGTIAAGQYGTWFAGVNLTNTQYSEGSKDEVLQLAGLNTTSTSNIEVRVRRDATAYLWDLLVFTECDNVLSVGNNAAATFERQ